jgi:hypothetical protein
VIFIYDAGEWRSAEYKTIVSVLTGLFVFSLVASIRIILLEVKILASPDDDDSA